MQVEKEEILHIAKLASLNIKEEDLKLLPNGLNSVPNEEIKKAFENSQK